LHRGSGVFSPKARESLLTEWHEKVLACRLEIADEIRVFFEELGLLVTGGREPFPGETRLRVTPRLAMQDGFKLLAERGLHLRDQLHDLIKVLKRFLKHLAGPLEESEDGLGDFELPLVELGSSINRLEDVRQAFTLLFDDSAPDREKFVHFFSLTVRGRHRWPALAAAPLEVAETMVSACFKPIPTVVLVSGTLSAGRQFTFVKHRLGLDHPEIQPHPLEGRFPSPFDYARQAAVFIPTDLPEPSHPDFMEQTIKPVYEIARVSAGGALILCTSYTHLDLLHTRLAPLLATDGLTCYRQGEMERSHLVRRFRDDGNAVLFATDSFWEGVDIPGSALRNLVITKLPFAIPNDPILEARQEVISRHGGNPFAEYQMPLAAIKLKQGFGRLIRHSGDRGTIWILDRRLATKFYGRYFLDSLPPAPVHQGPFTGLRQRAAAFFNER
jgi:ATP-dependent DNA helicase DinG